MATVYIVAQPLIGAMRSKAIYRLLGTLIGAAATVVLVPNLVDAPELLTAALALWTGVCLYIALLDRTPRSYLFMLAGYTAVLIGFPAVSTPDMIWDIALARAEEIGLGIICTTVIGTVVFPRELGPLLSDRILAWVGNASTWTEESAQGHRRYQRHGSAHSARGGCGRTQDAQFATRLRHLQVPGGHALGGAGAAANGVAAAAARLDR